MTLGFLSRRVLGCALTSLSWVAYPIDSYPVGVSYCIWRHHGLSAPEGWSSSRVRRQTNVPYNSNAQDVYSVI